MLCILLLLVFLPERAEPDGKVLLRVKGGGRTGVGQWYTWPKKEKKESASDRKERSAIKKGHYSIPDQTKGTVPVGWEAGLENGLSYASTSCVAFVWLG